MQAGRREVAGSDRAADARAIGSFGQSVGASLRIYPATACKAAFTRRPETVFAVGGSSVTLIALRRNQERKRSRN
jgi:hypothetical protein